MIFYTDTFIPKRFAGVAAGPFIFIRPRARNDLGLLMHEKEHVRQWWSTLGLHTLLYLCIPKYKIWAEVSAYKIQATYYETDKLPRFAYFIANNYGLNISEEQALSMLRK